MKKLLVILIFSAFVVSGCSYYTCPTYAEDTPEVQNQETTDQESTNP